MHNLYSEEEENIFNGTLEKLTDREDVTALDVFVQSQSIEDYNYYKRELADAYLKIFYIWHEDLVCRKISESHIPELFELIKKAESILPDRKIYPVQRAMCYKFLSQNKTEPEGKLFYIQKAIDEYKNALHNILNKDSEVNALLAEVYLDKMFIDKNFNDEVFNYILNLFQIAFTEYSETVFYKYSNAGFRILNLPFENKEKWHSIFYNQLMASMSVFAKKDPILYLNWSNGLSDISKFEMYEILPEYIDKLCTKSIELLTPLINYQTQNKYLINQLGFAFKRAAGQLKTDDITERLKYYEIALKYFNQGQDLEPTTWSFPVYATNVLKEMVFIYHKINDELKANELFETGILIFSKVPDHEKDFTLNIYWAEFLIEYSKFTLKNNSKEILKNAESKFLIAKELEGKHYSVPYTGLAKIYLMMGDRDKCMDILKKCGSIFSNEYYQYDFKEVFKNKDFEKIWEELQEWVNENKNEKS